MAIEAGRVLSTRYRLIRPVGQGSQASVWVAEHLALTTHVAVKLIDQELAKRESARERFRREATAAAQLRSAHVVQILDHGIDGDQPFIVMELLDGEDLFERLAHRTRLSLRETSKIVTQVARALSRAHAAGIVHRDLKPENVFLCPNEDDEVVKVLDFGVAKVKDAAKVTMQRTGVGTLIGTPHYMSPEQVKGIGEIDYRADLWALGVIAFQCVTGDLPYDSEGVGDLLIKITIGEAPIPSKVYPGVPTNFDVWFAKACARDPAKRFQSAREMALALAGVVGVVDGVAPRAPTVRPPAATLPGHGGVAPIPKAPRAPTEQLDASDWEEVDPFDEDDAPTRMKGPSTPKPPAAASAAPAVPSTPPATSQPKPAVPSAPSSLKSAQPAPGAAGRKPSPIATPLPAKLAPSSAPAKPAAAPAKTAPARPTKSPTTAAPPAPTAGRAPTPRSAPPPAPRPAAAEPVENHDSHDIVDFDETVPVTDNRPSMIVPLIVRARAEPASEGFAGAALTPLSEPPRSPAHVSPPPPPPPSPPVSQRSSGAPALIAPVVTTTPRLAVVPPPGPDAAPPSIPRPPPSSRNLAPQSAGSARPSAAPVVTPLEVPDRRGSLLTDPPPEFDGSSKRRRMVRIMVAGLVIAAVGITWTVVRSQFDASSGISMPPTTTTTAATSAAPAPPPPRPEPATASTHLEAAVDPGKVTHPTKPIPSVHKAPFRPRVPRQPNDGTIVVPEPDEESVPSAP